MVEVDVRDKGFTKKPLLAETISIMKEVLNFLPKQDIDLRTIKSITGRILAEDVIAKVDVPNFKRSMMDGYAVYYDDIKESSKNNHVKLLVMAENYIGEITNTLIQNTAIKVPTGGMVPDSADVVIKIEDTELMENEKGQKFIKIVNIPDIGLNISLSGEDYKKGEVVIPKYTRMAFTDMGAILSVGVFNVSCYKKPKIAIFPTGDELVDTNEELSPGQVYDSTTYVINEISNQLGFDLTRYSLVKDEKGLIIKRVKSLIPNFDIILMTGGTSVGIKDYIPIVINDLGKLYVHGASVRPGSPITAGIVSKKLIIGLPGFPVSTISSFLFFVIPLIYYMLGNYKFEYPLIKAVLTRDMKSKIGRRDFMRVKLEKNIEGKIVATPIMIAGSSLLRTISKSNGIVIIEENVRYLNKDQEVEVIPFTWLGKF